MPHALLVDDDSDAAETMAMLIANEGFTVATAGSLRDARRQMALQEPDIVLLDLMLPDGSGMELFNDAKQLPNAELVLITGHASLDTSIQAHGGNGMASEFGLADLWGMVRLLRIAPVSREMILNFVATQSLGLPKSY